MWSEAELHGSLNIFCRVNQRKNLIVELSADSSYLCFKIHFTAGVLKSKVNCAVQYYYAFPGCLQKRSHSQTDQSDGLFA